MDGVDEDEDEIEGTFRFKAEQRKEEREMPQTRSGIA